MRTSAALLLVCLSIVPLGCTVQGDSDLPAADGNWKVVALDPGSMSPGNNAILINTRTGQTWEMYNSEWRPMTRQ